MMKDVTQILPTYADVIAAHERIAPHIHRTPVLTSTYFDDLTAGDLFNRHAKDPGRVFDDAARRTELEARKRALSGDLEEALAWTRPKAKAAKLPKTIGKTLIGKAPALY